MKRKYNSSYLKLTRKDEVNFRFLYKYGNVLLEIVRGRSHSWLCLDRKKYFQEVGEIMGEFKSFKKALKFLEDKYVINSIKFMKDLKE